MHFPLATFAAAAITIAGALPTSLAADCYHDGGCSQCASLSDLQAAKQLLCGTNNWNIPGGFGFYADSGVADINQQGNFATSGECFAGFEDILQQCYGNKNGGTYDYTDGAKTAHLDIRFCAC